jgi:hypothetical protein
MKRIRLLPVIFPLSCLTSAVMAQSLPQVSQEKNELKLEIPYLTFQNKAYSANLYTLETTAELIFRVDLNSLKAVPFVEKEDDVELDPKDGACTSTAKAAFLSCDAEVEEEFFIGTGLCFNTSATDCTAKVLASEDEALEECADQLAARLQVCKAVGEAAYDPNMAPANFLSKAEIIANPNRFFPLKPGNKWVYATEDETITVTVSNETREILGITTIVVHDVVKDKESELIEDTDDWYAQDRQGNVWYMGEIARNYEDGRLSDLGGSWQAGKDGAKAGILFRATPVLNQTLRQEFLLGEAEDMSTTRSLTANETSGPALAIKCESKCLEVLEFTPLEPGAREFKYYYPGIGKILIVKPDSGKREELISYSLQ